jgi:hypothetical protein
MTKEFGASLAVFNYALRVISYALRVISYAPNIFIIQATALSKQPTHKY